MSTSAAWSSCAPASVAAPRAGRRAAAAGREPGRCCDGRSAEIVVSLEAVICGYRAARSGPRPVRPSPARRPRRAPRGPTRRAHRARRARTAAGKSTLLRTIAGQLPALEGFVRVGRNVMPGYLSQLRDRPLGGEHRPRCAPRRRSRDTRGRALVPGPLPLPRRRGRASPSASCRAASARASSSPCWASAR